MAYGQIDFMKFSDAFAVMSVNARNRNFKRQGAAGLEQQSAHFRIAGSVSAVVLLFISLGFSDRRRLRPTSFPKNPTIGFPKHPE